MANAPKKTNQPATPPSGGLTPASSPAMTTVAGFAVQIIGFIPIPRDDLKKQVEISTLMLDIQDGRKTFEALAPHLKNVEYRAVHLNRRFTVDDVNRWKVDPNQADLEEEIAKKRAAEEAAKAGAERKPEGDGDNS